MTQGDGERVAAVRWWAIGVGVVNEDGVGVRSYRTGVDVHARGGHRQSDTTVVGVVEGHDLALTGVKAHGPQGDVTGVGTGVPEVDPPITRTGHEGQQVLGQSHGIGVHRGESTRARWRDGRPRECLDDPGVAVTEAGGRPGRRQVDELSPTDLDQRRSATGLQRERKEP